MSKSTQSRKAELVEQVVDLLARKLKKEARERAETFLRAYYEWVAADDLLGETSENLLGSALSLWNLAARREPGTPRVRVHNPRVEEQGWKNSHTIVEIVNDDMPFLVDSVTAALNQMDLTVDLIIHPVVRVRRNDTGELISISAADTGKKSGWFAESCMHIEITAQSDPDMLAKIATTVEAVLGDVRAAVEDWRFLLNRVSETLSDLGQIPDSAKAGDRKEAQAFLKWVHDDHFTFLGGRDYRLAGNGKTSLKIVDGSGCGVLRDASVDALLDDNQRAVLLPEMRAFLNRPGVVLITKSSTRATVHRAVHMDVLCVKTFDKAGKVNGLRLFAGLFTSVAYSRSPRDIPLLRSKVETIVARSGFTPSSHDGKALVHILENYPRDELFQIGDEELIDISLGILQLQERQRVALFLRADPFARFMSLLIYVPRDRFNSALRLRMQEIVEAGFQGKVAAFYTQIGDAPLARLHFIVKTDPTSPPLFDAAVIEEQLTEAARSWADGLRDALIDEKGEEKGAELFRRYGEGFPSAYRERFTAGVAVGDIDRIEAAFESGALQMNLYRPIEQDEASLRFKIYHPGGPVPLSDVLPMLENMGLKVIDEIPFRIGARGQEERVWVHDFGMVTRSGAVADLSAVRDKFHDAFERIWLGEVENDGFNRLVLGGGLDWRGIVVLRAYCKYLRQAGITFSQDYMEDTLAANPAIVAMLVELFDAHMNPRREDKPDARAARLVVKIEEALEAVVNLDEDRILRRYLNLVQVTLRTNFFQLDGGGRPKPYVAFKLDSGAIDALPLPRPLVEIFVYSSRFEAVHLRGGKVARGGIRWSDRREDFRTEVLGLMKAQMVKNTVIVPVGSKGGFVVKQMPPPAAGRAALMDEVIACYKLFMAGMLDVTDNRDGDVVLPPLDVVRRDQDDPYLVVAADKGTATFSDIANSVSVERGFWLGDAFASGGSAGYDHKKMGITARGAWESVKRHFREIGKDIQKEDFTVVGIGDMAGDVFGNGMLLSKHIRLVGAFNHMHIFIDPDPDAAKSWVERKRLFDKPGSAWSDYSAKLISKGGGVFERSAKSIELSDEIRALLGVTVTKMPPNDLIRNLLKTQVELLWFGGIGTYVRASEESDADVGDRANDAVRVTATDLKCAVLGEGGNLGVTQRARIEYGLGGGRLNTDAIDNSAGVDTSDHEVNIKILLGDVVARGDMTMKQRNTLLGRMTDELAELVLRDNYQQTQALSIAQHLGFDALDAQVQLMRRLERKGRLNRALEFLPDDESLAERVVAKCALSRPEIAVLLAYAKLDLYDDLLHSDLPDDEALFDDLLLYFPNPLRAKYRAAIARHRLRREIIATVVTNSLINRMGPTFIASVADETGLAVSEIARAYAVTREVFGLRDLWAGIEALDNKAAAALQADLLVDIMRLAERATVWFLRREHPVNSKRLLENFGPGLRAVAGSLEKMISKPLHATVRRRADGLVKAGVESALAVRLSSLDLLGSACDIVAIAQGGGVGVVDAGKVYFALGARFGFDWLRAAATDLAPEGTWEKQAIAALVQDLLHQQSELTIRVLDAAGGSGIADKMIHIWSEAHAHTVEGINDMLDQFRSADQVGLAMIAVASGKLRALVGG